MVGSIGKSVSCIIVVGAGSIYFFFFNDRVRAEEYARKILSEIYDENDERTVGFVEERI